MFPLSISLCIKPNTMRNFFNMYPPTTLAFPRISATCSNIPTGDRALCGCTVVHRQCPERGKK